MPQALHLVGPALTAQPAVPLRTARILRPSHAWEEPVQGSVLQGMLVCSSSASARATMWACQLQCRADTPNEQAGQCGLEVNEQGSHLLLWGRHMEDMVVVQLVQGPPFLGLRRSLNRFRAPAKAWTGSTGACMKPLAARWLSSAGTASCSISSCMRLRALTGVLLCLRYSRLCAHTGQIKTPRLQNALLRILVGSTSDGEASGEG